MSTEYTAPSERAGSKVYRFFVILLHVLIALFLIIQGGKLVSLGGSSYYLIAGIAYLLIAILYTFRKVASLWLSILTFIATVIWAVSEVQVFDFWQYIPRLVVPTVLFVLSLWASRSLITLSTEKVTFANRVGLVGFIACVIALISAFFPHGKTLNQVNIAQDRNLTKPTAENPDNWEYFGRSGSGTRFAPYTDITPDNVKNLQIAWTYHTGRPKILESMKILQFKLVAHCTHVLQLILLLRLMVIAVKHFGNMIQKQKQLNTLPVVVLVTMMRLRIKRFQKQIYKLLVFKPAHNEF